MLGLSKLIQLIRLYQHVSQAQPRGISEKDCLLAGVKPLENLVRTKNFLGLVKGLLKFLILYIGVLARE